MVLVYRKEELVLKLKQSTVTAWLVMFMDFFHYIAFMCTKPYMKNMLDDAGIAPEITGFILSLFSIIQVVNALFLSKWIQKKGQKPQLIFGAALYVLTGLLLAFTPMIGGMFGGSSGIVEGVLITISILIMGTSHGIFLICGHYVITGLPKEEGRDKYVGYLTFINAIGQFIGPMLAAVCLAPQLMAMSKSGDYFFVLMISVVASGISLALACVIKNVTGGKTKQPAKVGAVLKDGPLMKIVFLNAAVYFAVDVVTSYIQAFGEETLLLTEYVATLVAAAMKFTAIFVRAFLGWLSKLVGSARLLRLSLLFVAISIVGMGLTNPIAEGLSGLGIDFMAAKIVVVMFFALLFGLANGLVNPLALIELSNASNSTNRSPALALRNMGNSGGQSVGEIVFGYLAGAFGTLSPVFLVSGGVLFGCFLLSFDKKKKPTEDAPTELQE